MSTRGAARLEKYAKQQGVFRQLEELKRAQSQQNLEEEERQEAVHRLHTFASEHNAVQSISSS